MIWNKKWCSSLLILLSRRADCSRENSAFPGWLGLCWCLMNILTSLSQWWIQSKWRNVCHLLDVLKAFDLRDPETWHMQLPRSIRIDLDVQFLSILAQQISVDQNNTCDHCKLCSNQTKGIIHRRVPLPQQLVVDLHRADVHGVRPHVLALFYFIEEVLQSPLVDARILNWALKIKPPQKTGFSHSFMNCFKLLNTWRGSLMSAEYLHGVSLPRACLSIGKYAHVIAIDAGGHKRPNLLENLNWIR